MFREVFCQTTCHYNTDKKEEASQERNQVEVEIVIVQVHTDFSITGIRESSLHCHAFDDDKSNDICSPTVLPFKSRSIHSLHLLLKEFSISFRQVDPIAKNV